MNMKIETAEHEKNVNCQHCTFSDVVTLDIQVDPADPADRLFLWQKVFCRFNAPVYLADGACRWPQVELYDCCGQWREANAARITTITLNADEIESEENKKALRRF